VVTVKLLGEAGRVFGRSYRLDIATPKEAIRALCSQLKGLRQYLRSSEERGINWRVVTDISGGEGTDEEQLDWPCGEFVVLAPIPVGCGGFGRILAGIALVAVAIFVPCLGFARTLIGGLGTSFILSGMSDAVVPEARPPGASVGETNSKKPEGPKRSALFSRANVNSTQGDVMPLLLGRRKVGNPAVISFGLSIQNSL